MTTTMAVTGTRRPPPAAQLSAINDAVALRASLGVTKLRHGACEGADLAFARIGRHYDLHVVAHPANGTAGRHQSTEAIALSDEVCLPLPPLERNKVMVDVADLLLAAPDGPERTRSGTWATVRYARKLGVPVLVIWPDGRIELG